MTERSVHSMVLTALFFFSLLAVGFGIAAIVTNSWYETGTLYAYSRRGLFSMCVAREVASAESYQLRTFKEECYSPDYADFCGHKSVDIRMRFVWSAVFSIVAVAAQFAIFIFTGLFWLNGGSVFAIRSHPLFFACFIPPVCTAIGLSIFVHTVDSWYYCGTNFCIYVQLEFYNRGNCTERFGYSFYLALISLLCSMFTCVCASLFLRLTRLIGTAFIHSKTYKPYLSAELQHEYGDSDSNQNNNTSNDDNIDDNDGPYETADDTMDEEDDDDVHHHRALYGATPTTIPPHSGNLWGSGSMFTTATNNNHNNNIVFPRSMSVGGNVGATIGGSSPGERVHKPNSSIGDLLHMRKEAHTGRVMGSLSVGGVGGGGVSAADNILPPTPNYYQFRTTNNNNSNVNNNNTTTNTSTTDHTIPPAAAPKAENLVSDWVPDAATGLLWSPSEELFLNKETGQFYDPTANKWYNPTTGEWESPT